MRTSYDRELEHIKQLSVLLVEMSIQEVNNSGELFLFPLPIKSYFHLQLQFHNTIWLYQIVLYHMSCENLHQNQICKLWERMN